jgi:hypothetical protein
MRPIDFGLAIAGRSYDVLRRRSRWVPVVVVAGLLLVSIVPVLIVGSTKQPNPISIEDFQNSNLPPGATWFRFEGDLREAPGAAPYTYTLHDLSDDSRAITVVATAPLQTGHVQITGRPDGPWLPDTFLSIQADIPTEPARHDPWLLYAVPTLLAVVIVVGAVRGYPVLRREGASSAVVDQLYPGERLAARWAGWIGNERHDFDAMSPCTLAVTCDADVCQVTVADAHGEHTVTHQRASPNRRIRLCRTSGVEHAIEVHAPAADLFLVFDDVKSRDRFARSIG